MVLASEKLAVARRNTLPKTEMVGLGEIGLVTPPPKSESGLKPKPSYDPVKTAPT